MEYAQCWAAFAQAGTCACGPVEQCILWHPKSTSSLGHLLAMLESQTRVKTWNDADCLRCRAASACASACLYSTATLDWCRAPPRAPHQKSEHIQTSRQCGHQDTLLRQSDKGIYGYVHCRAASAHASICARCTSTLDWCQACAPAPAMQSPCSASSCPIC